LEQVPEAVVVEDMLMAIQMVAEVVAEGQWFVEFMPLML
jgi:hypothetical protein